MYRYVEKLILLVTAFTLLWTGTFLHDAFSGESSSNARADMHNTCTDSGARVLPSEADYEGEQHLHGPIATSHIRELLLQRIDPLLELFAVAVSIRLDALRVEALPFNVFPTKCLLSPKIYLLNRTLLI